MTHISEEEESSRFQFIEDDVYRLLVEVQLLHLSGDNRFEHEVVEVSDFHNFLELVHLLVESVGVFVQEVNSEVRDSLDHS